MSNRRPVNRVTRRPKVAGTAAKASDTENAESVVDDAASTTAVEDRKAPWRPSKSFTLPNVGDYLARLRPATAPSLKLFVGLVVAAVLLTALAVLAAFKPGANPANQAFIDAAATDQVKAAARTTLTTLYGYDAAHIDGWKDAADKVITGKMRQDFDKTADVTISGIKQTGVKTDVSVDPIGVTQLQGDKAEVLVNLQVSSTKDGQSGDAARGPLVLRMVKVDGKWLGSDVVDKD